MSTMNTIPDDTPAIVRVSGAGERCGQVTVVAAAFIPASECERNADDCERLSQRGFTVVHPGWSRVVTA